MIVKSSGMSGKLDFGFRSEAYFEALVRYATAGILVAYGSGKIKLANACLQKLVGFSTGAKAALHQPAFRNRLSLSR